MTIIALSIRLALLLVGAPLLAGAAFAVVVAALEGKRPWRRFAWWRKAP